MNKFATTVLNVLDRALSGNSDQVQIPPAGTYILKTHGKRGTAAVIKALQDQCAAAGKPQPAFTKGPFIGKANAEIDRLRDVLSGAPPTSIHIAPSVAAFPGSPGPSLPTAAPAAAPTPQLARYACIKALDVLGIKTDGRESVACLNAMLHEAKSAWQSKQISYDKALAEYGVEAAAHPEPPGYWNSETLAVLIEQIAGPGTDRQINTMPYTDEKNPIRAGSPADRERRFNNQRAFIAGLGISIKGLDLSGCPPDLAEGMTPRKIEMAQKIADEFTDVLSGDAMAQRATTRTAGLARQAVAQFNNKSKFVLGMTTNLKG